MLGEFETTGLSFVLKRYKSQVSGVSVNAGWVMLR